MINPPCWPMHALSRVTTMSTITEPPLNPRRSHRIWSRLTRRWSLILALWLLITIPVLSLISLIFEPRYEAVSILRVSPPGFHIIAPTPDPRDSSNDAYLATQVALITSDRVLGVAIASPEVVKLSTIKGADDPRGDLRRKISVQIIPGASLLRVALELPDGNEAATIVNAVVHSYLAYNGEHARSTNSTLRKSLSDQLDKYKIAIGEKRAELRALFQRSTAEFIANAKALNESGKLSDRTRSTLGVVTEAQSERIADDLINTDLELIKAQSILEATEAASKGDNDPAFKQTLGELRLKVAALVKQREYQIKYLDGLKPVKKNENEVSADVNFLSRQLDALMAREDAVKAHLEQLDFDASRADYRVTLVDGAVASKVPVASARGKYMALAPIGILLALMGLALLTPIKGERSHNEA
jgi:uncharacterized protein involved in exopolysaccharide biosynthesis